MAAYLLQWKRSLKLLYVAEWPTHAHQLYTAKVYQHDKRTEYITSKGFSVSKLFWCVTNAYSYEFPCVVLR